jgi:hypothetical protein
MWVRGRRSNSPEFTVAGAVALFALACQICPGQTGIILLSSNLHAFVARAHAARIDGRSLDLPYYCWREVLTRGLLGKDVLAATDREFAFEYCSTMCLKLALFDTLLPLEVKSIAIMKFHNFMTLDNS